MSLGDFISVFSEVRAFLERRIQTARLDELMEIRLALKEIYFGDKTLVAFEEAQAGNLSKAAIAMGESGKPVRKALHRLRELAKEDGLSIRTRETLLMVIDAKCNLRESLSMSLFFQAQGGEPKTDTLRAEIENLNRTIEEVDIVLAGVRL